MLQPLRTVIVHVAEPFSVGFNIGGTALGLDPDPAAGAAGGGGTTAYWRVRDADQACAHLLSIGGVSRKAVHDVGGGIRVASVLDPFGNAIGVIEIPGEGNTPPPNNA